MSDIEFKLGTFSNNGGGPFVGLVIGEKIYTLSTVVEAAEAQGGGKGPTTTAGIYEMLADWDANFDALCAVADFVANDGRGDADWDCVATLSDLRVLPPILNPSKMIYAAANYGGHIREMLNAGTARTEEERANMLDRDKARVRPYSFLKAPSSLAGAFDDIVIPPETQKVDWEVELALVIGRTAKRVPAERALDYVAGYMTTNDVTARDAQSRPDWPTLRTDWFTGKSHDTFAPMGPYLVPTAFVPDYRAVQLTLKVNGETKQDDPAGEMVFSAEEQIEHASAQLALHPGDIISTGTPEGVGHGKGTYLNVGDIVEAEAAGLGAQRCQVVAEDA
ncbi:MAG: fumarylacetoacetate hydrolase family protein [Alphaproteobacteria bacterium]|nr:fumarylacetoacetate hydrolase family protein [Alphaproteobacteria bacterium]